MKQRHTDAYFRLKHSFYKNNRITFAVGMAATLIAALAMPLVSYVLGAIVDAVTNSDRDRLARLLMIVIAGSAAFTLIDLLMIRARAAFYRRAIVQYRMQAFQGIVSKSICAFSRENTGSYLSMLTNDVTAIRDKYLYNLFELGTQLVMLVGGLAMMFLHSVQLTLVALAFCFLPMAVVALMSKELVKREKAVSDSNERYVAALKDILSGFAVIKSFQAEKPVGDRFQESNALAEQKKFISQWWTGMLTTFSSLGGLILQFGVFFTGALLALNGKITPGAILAFVNLCNCFISPIQLIPKYVGEMGAAKALVEKLSRTLDANAGRTGDAVPAALADGIELKNVSFGYERDKPVLKNLSFKFEKGKKYAVVGNSGSGKTTLLNLLMGAYDEYEGAATVDGKELRFIAPESLFDLMSLIGQNVFLFDDTIRKNVTMFTSYPDSKVADAMARAGLTGLISEKGEDYRCGENGVQLSGGEKQRVSIARCLLRNTPVLLMDEATAALDNETSFEIVNAILQLEGLTRVVVTHRLESELLKQYDQILVLWNGTIAECGTFEALLEKKDRFYSLYNLSR